MKGSDPGRQKADLLGKLGLGSFYLDSVNSGSQRRFLEFRKDSWLAPL